MRKNVLHCLIKGDQDEKTIHEQQILLALRKASTGTSVSEITRIAEIRK